MGLIFLSLFPHFLQDWDHLVERRSLRRVFIHTNLDEFAHVVADAGGNVHPETFSGDLEKNVLVKTSEVQKRFGENG